jgi:RNA polymerase sigma factor (sigma-70 family)
MSAVTAIPTDSVGSTDERELLVRVQAGDRGAFDLLVRRYLPRARVIARRLLQDPDDADDLVQDAFLRALERIASFDVSRAFEPWFTRLLMNLGLDQRRKQMIPRLHHLRNEKPVREQAHHGLAIREQGA